MEKNKKKTKKEEIKSKSQDNFALGTRGRNFEGYVVKKISDRVKIEFERIIYVKKYERYAKKKTVLHAKLPLALKDEIKVGDYVRIMECKPMSKLIHFIVAEKIRGGTEKK